MRTQSSSAVVGWWMLCLAMHGLNPPPPPTKSAVFAYPQDYSGSISMNEFAALWKYITDWQNTVCTRSPRVACTLFPWKQPQESAPVECHSA